MKIETRFNIGDSVVKRLDTKRVHEVTKIIVKPSGVYYELNNEAERTIENTYKEAELTLAKVSLINDENQKYE